jgi:hypothetical protein
VESARLFPLVPAGSAPALVAQAADVFQGGLLGAQAAAGVTPALDLQLGTWYPVGGGGWRVGAKYQFLQGRIAAAAMAGYGRLATKGTVTYRTATGTEDLTQTLSGYQVDLGVPASFRLGANVAAFGGLTLFRSGVSGASGSGFVADTSHDLGANLGLKLMFGRFEGDIEFALLRLRDPFADAMRFAPYWGLSGGIVF